jgi:hypothetical protein
MKQERLPDEWLKKSELDNLGPGSYESNWKVDAARIRRERQVYEHNLKSAITDARINGTPHWPQP